MGRKLPLGYNLNNYCFAMKKSYNYSSYAKLNIACETARAKDAYYYYHGITLISHDGPSLPYHIIVAYRVSKVYLNAW